MASARTTEPLFSPARLDAQSPRCGTNFRVRRSTHVTPHRCATAGYCGSEHSKRRFCHLPDTEGLKANALLETTVAGGRIGHHQHYEFATGKSSEWDAFCSPLPLKWAKIHECVFGLVFRVTNAPRATIAFSVLASCCSCLIYRREVSAAKVDNGAGRRSSTCIVCAMRYRYAAMRETRMWRGGEPEKHHTSSKYRGERRRPSLWSNMAPTPLGIRIARP